MTTRLLTLGTLVLLGSAIIYSFSGTSGYKYPTGAPAGHTGSPGDGKNCTFCHGGTATAVTGVLTSNVPPTGYIAGSTYTFTVTLSGSGRKGFQASPQNFAGNQLGTLIAGAGTQLVGSGKYVTHTQASNSATATWNFQWVAPAQGTGSVTMYIARVISQPNVGLSSLVINENFSVGIANIFKTGFKVYPNPANNTIFVDIQPTESGLLTAEAIPLNGMQSKVLYHENVQAGKQTIRIENTLPAGYYLIRVTTPKETYSEKLIII